jgi:hypothetical protein
VEKINIRRNQYSSTSMQLANEYFNIMGDRPIQKGGSGKGIVGGSIFTFRYCCCFYSNLFASANSRNVNLIGLKVNVIALISNTPKRFTSRALEESNLFLAIQMDLINF